MTDGPTPMDVGVYLEAKLGKLAEKVEQLENIVMMLQQDALRHGQQIQALRQQEVER